MEQWDSNLFQFRSSNAGGCNCQDSELDLSPKFVSFKGTVSDKKVIVEHTVGGGDTLSQIVLERYGHAT